MTTSATLVRAGVAVVAIAAASAATLTAVELRLSEASIEEAITIGFGSNAVRDQFDAPYTVRVYGPAIESVEITSPFRRVVLDAASRHVARGARPTWDRALATLGPLGDAVMFRIRVTFPPQSAFSEVPPYDVQLFSVDEPKRPGIRGDVLRSIRYRAGGGEVDLAQPVGGPMLGANLDATFRATQLEPRGAYYVTVSLHDEELQRVRVDLTPLR